MKYKSFAVFSLILICLSVNSVIWVGLLLIPSKKLNLQRELQN